MAGKESMEGREYGKGMNWEIMKRRGREGRGRGGGGRRRGGEIEWKKE